jgi:hypothetical protein
MFYFQQNWRIRGQNRFCPETEVWGVWPKRCINVKMIKKERKKE